MLLDCKTVRCPQCGGESIYSTTNPNRPFCCSRCKRIDLGAWANEEFRVHREASTDATIFEKEHLQ